MTTVVMKFGGSSVADVAKLRRVAEQIVARKRAGEGVVAVVSAMGKTTDALIAQARDVSPEPPMRELDMLVTAGERIAMALLSMAIHEAGEEAISFTGSQSGIITEDQHQGARILEVKPQRIEEALAKDRIVIVAGFQGVSHKREITTLGRGGSDTTAVALAAALQASACEIYSDVDGVYTADPNVCPQAKLLPELSYETMQAMASVGAKVLNADAVEFARRAGIVIHARKTGDSSGRETRVVEAARTQPGVVAAVGATSVTELVGASADVPALTQQLASCGARTMLLSTVGERAVALVDRTGVPGRDHARVALVSQSFAAREVGLATLVGAGLSSRPTLLAEAQQALQQDAVLTQSFVLTDSALSFVVAPHQTDLAVRVLHARFIV